MTWELMRNAVSQVQSGPSASEPTLSKLPQTDHVHAEVWETSLRDHAAGKESFVKENEVRMSKKCLRPLFIIGPFTMAMQNQPACPSAATWIKTWHTTEYCLSTSKGAPHGDSVGRLGDPYVNWQKHSTEDKGHMTLCEAENAHLWVKFPSWVEIPSMYG